MLAEHATHFTFALQAPSVLETVEVSTYSAGELPDLAASETDKGEWAESNPPELPLLDRVESKQADRKFPPDPNANSPVLYGQLMVPVDKLWIPPNARSLPPGPAGALTYPTACKAAMEFNGGIMTRLKHRWAAVAVRAADRHRRYGIVIVDLARGGDRENPMAFPPTAKNFTRDFKEAMRVSLSTNRDIMAVARTPKLWSAIVVSIEPEYLESLTASPDYQVNVLARMGR